MKHALSFVGGVLLTLLLVALLYPEPKAGNGHNIVIQTDTIIKRDTVRDVPENLSTPASSQSELPR